MGAQYVPSLFLCWSKFTAVLMPMAASTMPMSVVGTCMTSRVNSLTEGAEGSAPQIYHG